MDWQRTLLIGLLAIVSYAMIYTWNQDYGSKQHAASETKLPQSYSQGDTPVITESPKGSEDLPSVTNSEKQSLPALVSDAQSAKKAGGLIRVETDVLSVEISTLGGDVVSVRLKAYPISIEDKGTPISILAETAQTTYVAQSGLAGINGPDSNAAGRPQYTTDQTEYELKGDHLVVPLHFVDENGVKVTKTFEFAKGSYVIKNRYDVHNTSSQPWTAAFFAQIKRDNSPDPGVQHTTGFGLPTFLGVAYWSPEKPYNKEKFDALVKTPLDLKGVTGGWMAIIQHYFLAAWIPDQNQQYDYSTAAVKGNTIARIVGHSVTVAPGASQDYQASLYVGPKIQKTLEALVPGKGLDLVVDYGPLFFISKILFWLLSTFHALTANWGVSIILLTVTIKALFFYPSAISYRSMAKMRTVQPALLRLREQYADDRQKLSQEMMKLYRDNKINPLGGCLPILIQMPVFLALYWALLESVELRQAPFFGWLTDLSVMDPYFILPLIMGGTMYIQTALNPAPPDPMQAKLMKFMPIIFTVMFLWFPAGLVVYWITNNSLSILQQWIITRKIEAEGIKHS
ncbi:Preprotein translocase subunit [gamma proteobacterium HdN1]|nr:Preprotein translocase subunit [gamma proteobacterium HdN1]